VSWEKVAALDELQVGVPRRVELAEPICVVRTGEAEVHVVHDTCSHQEYPLSEGWVEGCEIECGLHGSQFDLRTGKPDVLPAVKAVPTYAAKIEDGGVWVDLDQQTNDAPVPRHY
jgi:3-phenylpropionate/trans-cinnamate dioxygenase ferredoxin subunit